MNRKLRAVLRGIKKLDRDSWSTPTPTAVELQGQIAEYVAALEAHHKVVLLEQTLLYRTHLSVVLYELKRAKIPLTDDLLQTVEIANEVLRKRPWPPEGVS